MSLEDSSSRPSDDPSGDRARPIPAASEEVAGEDRTSGQPVLDLPLFSSQPPDDERREESRQRDPGENATRVEAQTGSVAPSSERSPGDDDGAPESAPLGDRLVAAALDVAALALTLGLLIGLSALMGVTVRTADLWLYLPTWLAFGFFYQVLPLLFWGRTPGMMLAEIESRDREGGPLTLQQASLRWLAALVTSALLGLPGFLALTGRSLTDRLSGSRTLISS